MPPLRRPLRLAAFAFATLLHGCGGGNGDIGTTGNQVIADGVSSAAAVQLNETDLLGLYPHFAMSLMGIDSAMLGAMGFRQPLLDEDPNQDCDLGIAATMRAPNVANVTFTDCSLVFNTDGLPGVTEPLKVMLTKRGSVAYRLVRAAGDFAAARQNFDLDFTTAFDNVQTISLVEKIGQPNVETNVSFRGNVAWSYKNANVALTRGQVAVATTDFAVTMRLAGRAFTSTVRDTSTLWTHGDKETLRAANITLADSPDSPFAGKPIVLRNIVPARFNNALPDFTATTPTSEIEMFSHPVGGADLLTYGRSKVYAVYQPDGLTLEMDFDGNDCIESRLTLTKKQLNQAILTQQPLPAASVVRTTACVAPTYR